MGLSALSSYGFVLAGGYALQAHQLVDRLSEDIDLFTDRWDREEFTRAVDAVCKAYRTDGLDVAVPRRAEAFARIQVTDPQAGRIATVDLAADFRQLDPVQLSVGPVLAERDAVSSKVATVFSRGEARDYLDLAGILDSGRFTREELIRLGSEADRGFSKGWFAEALAGVDRFPEEDFAGYGVDSKRIAQVKETMRSWSSALRAEIARETVPPSVPEVTRSIQTPTGPAYPQQRGRGHPSPSPWTTGPSGTPETPSRGPEIGF